MLLPGCDAPSACLYAFVVYELMAISEACGACDLTCRGSGRLGNGCDNNGCGGVQRGITNGRTQDAEHCAGGGIALCSPARRGVWVCLFGLRGLLVTAVRVYASMEAYKFTRTCLALLVVREATYFTATLLLL